MFRAELSPVIITLAVVLSLAHSEYIFAQCEFAKITASDPQPTDGFALEVASDEGLAIVGAYGHDQVGPMSGVAYVYRQQGDNWVQEAQLFPNDGEAEDLFGYSVAVENDIVAIGAIHDNDIRGSVYVFRYFNETWVEEQTLMASDGAPGDNFGISVSISGDVICVGANGASNTGAAYIFRYLESQWQEEQKLVGSAAEPLDQIGESVSNDGDVVVVGAFADTVGTLVSAGSAYIFRYASGEWVEEAHLVAPDPSNGALFGGDVAIHQDTVLVGAENSQSAYVFRHDGTAWPLEQHLFCADPTPPSNFGRGTAVHGNRILVGDWASNNIQGVVHVFEFDGSTWSEQPIITPVDSETPETFGRSVSLVGNTALISAQGSGPGHVGAAYVFSFASPDCNGNGICDHVDIQSGQATDNNGNNVPDTCEQFVRGDCLASGLINLVDATFLLAVLFLGSMPPDCLDACDVDDDGTLGLVDPIYLLDHLFLGGPNPPLPWPECGIDATLDEFLCLQFVACP